MEFGQVVVVAAAYACGVVGLILSLGVIAPRTSAHGWHNRILLLLSALIAHWMSIALPLSLLLHSARITHPIPTETTTTPLTPCTIAAFWWMFGDPARFQSGGDGAGGGRERCVLGGFLVVCLSAVMGAMVLCESRWGAWYWVALAVLLAWPNATWCFWWAGKTTANALDPSRVRTIVLCGAAIGASLVLALHLAVQSANPALFVPDGVAWPLLHARLPVLVVAALLLVTGAHAAYRYRRQAQHSPAPPRATRPSLSSSPPVTLRWIIFHRNNKNEPVQLLVSSNNNSPPATEILDEFPKTMSPKEVMSLFDALETHTRTTPTHPTTHPTTFTATTNNTALHHTMSPNAWTQQHQQQQQQQHRRPSTAVQVGGRPLPLSSRWQMPLPAQVKAQAQASSEAFGKRRAHFLSGVGRLFRSLDLSAHLPVIRRRTHLYYELVDNTLFLVTNLATDPHDQGGQIVRGVQGGAVLADELVKNLAFRWLPMADLCRDNGALAYRLVGRTADAAPPSPLLRPISTEPQQKQHQLQHQRLHQRHRSQTNAVQPMPRTPSLTLLHKTPEAAPAGFSNGAIEKRLTGQALLDRLLRFSLMASKNVFLPPLPRGPLPPHQPNIATHDQAQEQVTVAQALSRADCHVGLVYGRVCGGETSVLIRRASADGCSSLLPIVRLPPLDEQTESRPAINRIPDRTPPPPTGSTEIGSTAVVVVGGAKCRLEQGRRALGELLGTDEGLARLCLSALVLDASACLILFTVNEMVGSLTVPPGYQKDQFQFVPLRVLLTLAKHQATTVAPAHWPALVLQHDGPAALSPPRPPPRPVGPGMSATPPPSARYGGSGGSGANDRVAGGVAGGGVAGGGVAGGGVRKQVTAPNTPVRGMMGAFFSSPPPTAVAAKGVLDPDTEDKEDKEDRDDGRARTPLSAVRVRMQPPASPVSFSSRTRSSNNNNNNNNNNGTNDRHAAVKSRRMLLNAPNAKYAHEGRSPDQTPTREIYISTSHTRFYDNGARAESFTPRSSPPPLPPTLEESPATATTTAASTATAATETREPIGALALLSASAKAPLPLLRLPAELLTERSGIGAQEAVVGLSPLAASTPANAPGELPPLDTSNSASGNSTFRLLSPRGSARYPYETPRTSGALLPAMTKPNSTATPTTSTATIPRPLPARFQNAPTTPTPKSPIALTPTTASASAQFFGPPVGGVGSVGSVGSMGDRDRGAVPVLKGAEAPASSKGKKKTKHKRSPVILVLKHNDADAI